MNSRPKTLETFDKAVQPTAPDRAMPSRSLMKILSDIGLMVSFTVGLAISVLACLFPAALGFYAAPLWWLLPYAILMSVMYGLTRRGWLLSHMSYAIRMTGQSTEMAAVRTTLVVYLTQLVQVGVIYGLGWLLGLVL